MAELTPLALKDAPALIEGVFPAQKVSFEAQRERKAGANQTLTALGSYWKGRKPLILVRAVVLGSLLPQTKDHEKDLEIFELLMAFDNEGLARRALVQNSIKPGDFASLIRLENPWDFFSFTIKASDLTAEEVETWVFPFNADAKAITLRWRRDINDVGKLALYRKALATFGNYDEKALLCKRPEDVDQEWLYDSIWGDVNRHYAQFGIKANSHQELVEQLGVLRYGHCPRVGDTFSGGGSIPFESARLGCEIYASDLNPIACMLTWGALNIIGTSRVSRDQIIHAQQKVFELVDKEIVELGIEHDRHGNRAKAYLYCLETKCPETGWKVPLLPTRILSVKYKTIVELVPSHENKSFDINVLSKVSKIELKKAATGTVQDGSLVYELDGKVHRTTIKTLRGDYRDPEGVTRNSLRQWDKSDFMPRPDDIFQERLYAIQWITNESLKQNRQKTFFASVSEDDLAREKIVENIVSSNLAKWHSEGLIPNMEIEPGDKTDEPIRTRGWRYWHHLFNARGLLLQACKLKHSRTSIQYLRIARDADRIAKLCRYNFNPQPTQGPKIEQVFSDQAINPLLNYATYSFIGLEDYVSKLNFREPFSYKGSVKNHPAAEIDDDVVCDIYVTDPPYADAVNYHEITEFFISWLRKNPPPPFNEWMWDSRRALAIKGSGDNFRRSMIDAYRAMAEHMPDNGMQCVMFTHQDTGVWSDMIGIFWAAGLQVVAAWYIATETTSELKKGGYVQGTVILMLRKRAVGDRAGFKQRILPAVRTEVKHQIETMMHLNDEVKDKLGEPVFNDSDLQMAGYAAALKVLTAYTQIGGEDVTDYAMRPRQRGEVTLVDEIVQQAAEAANSLLVPEGIDPNTWHKLTGIQRFYLRMMDMESAGVSKLDNYQNFAKAFRVVDYTKVMANMTANKARLKHVTDFTSRDLTESTELGATWLGRLIIGLQQLLAETEPQVVIGQLQAELPDFMEIRPLLIDLLEFFERMAPEDKVRQVAEILGARLRNLRALSQ